ncbi:ATP-binding protein [Sulfurimonas sp.]|nr:ATP-binding protein [Sulfurimonas sp.]
MLILLVFALIFSIYHYVKLQLSYAERLEFEVQEKTKELTIAKDKAEYVKLTLDKSLKAFGLNVISSDSDTKGIITYASDALCKISGYSNDELVGQPHSILRHPDTQPKVFEEMWDDLKQEKTWQGEIKNAKKDGGFYWVKNTISPKYGENNKLIGYSSIRNNITSEKVKEEFMANMSHELRTPLNAIIGFSSILNKKQTDSKHKELSNTINTSALSLLGLINNILDLSKIENSNFTINPYEFNAYNEFSRFSEQFEGLTNKKVIEYYVEINNELKGIFFGDWDRISQIILNLISNSIKFTPKNGLIKVCGNYQDGSLIITVVDNGIGMNKDVQNKVFKPFSQADGSTTRKYGGTGLGLSITQSLVGLMGGYIELESAEGEGTTFKVTIPLQKVQEERNEDTQIPISEEVKEDSLAGHILIVEDNKTNQMLVRMLITDFGLTCDVANDGLEAVTIYDPQKHLLVLMDENMPNLNGIKAMKAIREKYKEKTTPIIALTANAMEGDKERFLEVGMDGYLAKPIDEDELYNTLKEFL